jgi:hypothetical protein
VQWQRDGETRRLVEGHNDWYGGVLGFRPSSTDKTSNPLFVNLTAGDFRVQAGSPAIDAGTTIHAPADDFEQSGRPRAAAPDIGAYMGCRANRRKDRMSPRQMRASGTERRRAVESSRRAVHEPLVPDLRGCAAAPAARGGCSSPGLRLHAASWPTDLPRVKNEKTADPEAGSQP